MTWIDGDTMPTPKGAVVDDTQAVTFTSWVRADRHKRQIIAAIYSADNPEDLDAYVEGETVIIDALFLFDPEMAAAITEAHEDVRAQLTAAQTPSREEDPSTAVPVQSYEGKRKMANNTDFHKVVVKDVEFLWPRLDQTYRYNSAEKKTEPCEPTANGAGWSLAWKMSLADGKKLKDELRAHYEDCRSRNRKLPEFSDVFGAKRLTDEDGNPTDAVQFTAKKRAMSNDGKPNKQPKVVGLDLKELEEKNIWSGSVGHIRALAFPTTDPDGMGGISLLLDAVQVVDAQYGGDGLEDDFGPAQTAAPNFGDDEPKTERRADDEF